MFGSCMLVKHIPQSTAKMETVPQWYKEAQGDKDTSMGLVCLLLLAATCSRTRYRVGGVLSHHLCP